jgi:hypothetical protein
MEKESSMISLSRDDWSEIFYALESKALAVRQGQYGYEEAVVIHVDEHDRP